MESLSPSQDIPAPHKLIIYKTTNSLNGKFYVGKHIFKNGIEDDYLGSGTIFKRAVKKHGRDKFKRETLEECQTIEELNAREIYWIETLNARDLAKAYNIGTGGYGGDNYTHNPNKEVIKEKLVGHLTSWRNSLSKEESFKFHSRPGDKNSNWRGGSSTGNCIDCGKFQSHPDRKRCMECRAKSYIGNGNPFSGKHHTDESKQKSRNAKLGKQNPNCSFKVSINGVVYRSYGEASKSLNVSTASISLWVRNKVKPPKYISSIFRILD